MKWFSRGLGLSLMSLGLLGALGCQEDNESAARAQAKGTEVVNPNPEPVNSQEEYFKQKKDPFAKGAGYPGSQRQPAAAK